ncbi:MAG TPA: efflux RND transporter periplasmic adaptor subunit [Gemmatimonadales bacterium]|nr:efflux RND transporter periplasmic adaptor subunit [Gemmatimonadales bacterium]
MSRRMKLGLASVVLILLVGSVVMLSAAKKGGKPVEVKMDKVAARNLVSVVTASGKIRPKTSVDVSSDIQGRIVKIGVKEGDLVKKGQFLLQIDPAQYEAAVSRAKAFLASSQGDLIRAKANMDQAKRVADRNVELQKTGSNLVATETVENATTNYDVAVANYASSKAAVEQAQAGLTDAQQALSKTTLVAPMDGRVVRLAVETGEVAVPGTFSKDVGLLMTIADLSVILAKVQVDETDVVRLHMGDSVQVSIDAFPDTSFVGHVTKISNSAQLTSTSTASGSNDKAVDFDVEITLAHPPTDVRPDLSSTARIVTDTRTNVLSVPIIALTVRANEPVPNESVKRDTTKKATAKKESEGVFVVNDGVATFRPVKIGIAGDDYFEILDGLKPGETIVSGTYQAIRDLHDGAKVKAPKADSTKGPKMEMKKS